MSALQSSQSVLQRPGFERKGQVCPLCAHLYDLSDVLVHKIRVGFSAGVQWSIKMVVVFGKHHQFSLNKFTASAHWHLWLFFFLEPPVLVIHRVTGCLERQYKYGLRVAQLSLSVVIWASHFEHHTARSSDTPCRENHGVVYAEEELFVIDERGLLVWCCEHCVGPPALGGMQMLGDVRQSLGCCRVVFCLVVSCWYFG